MVVKTILAVIAGIFSMLIFDPYFIYGYFKNKFRKKRGEPYRDYLLILKEPFFWLCQILSLSLTVIFSMIIIQKFSSSILTDALIYIGILNMMYFLNTLLCVNKTDIYKIFNYVNALLYRVIFNIVIVFIILII